MAVSQSNIKDTGSNYSFGDKVINPDIKRSRFDCSYTNYFTAEEGALYPVYFQFFQPNEDYELSVESFIRVINPPVVPLLSGQRVFFHYYACTMPQLWSNWQAFMTKGRSGNVVFSVPQVSTGASAGEIKSLYGRGTLFDFLYGSLPSSILTSSNDNRIELKYNALPFMMYQKIYRDYYMNQRLNSRQDMANHGNNEVWFPYDDADFRIDSKTGTILNTGSSSSWYVHLNHLRYRNYADDYFTSALESPMLGDVSSLNGEVVIDSARTGFVVDGILKDVYARMYKHEGNLYPFVDSSQSGQSPAVFSVQNYVNGQGVQSSDFLGGLLTTNGSYAGNLSSPPETNTYKLSTQVVGHGELSITANNIRDLLVLSHIAEKHARIDGSYSEYIKTFFDKRPRSGQDYRPTYIGGSYQRIQFSEVLQTTESSNSPLGLIGGKGASGDSGYIGRYHSDDYGFIMGIMSIIPDTIYSTGVNRSLLYTVQEDFPLPERQDLGMQAIFNKELFWTGDDTIDNGLYGYQDRFDELRYHANEIHGKFGDDSNDTFNPYTQYRKITTTPTLTQSFITLGGNNINKNWRSVANEVPYGCQVYTRSHAVKPMPYKAVPVGLL